MSAENSGTVKPERFFSRFHNVYTAWILLLLGFLFTGAA